MIRQKSKGYAMGVEHSNAGHSCSVLCRPSITIETPSDQFTSKNLNGAGEDAEACDIPRYSTTKRIPSFEFQRKATDVHVKRCWGHNSNLACVRKWVNEQRTAK
jgi:hypothetical protein